MNGGNGAPSGNSFTDQLNRVKIEKTTGLENSGASNLSQGMKQTYGSYFPGQHQNRFITMQPSPSLDQFIPTNNFLANSYAINPQP